MCRFFSLYHSAVSSRVKELAFEDLEANEIVSLLTWVLNTYKRYTSMSEPQMCSPDILQQNVVSLERLFRLWE